MNETVTLDFIARQQQRILDELTSMREQVTSVREQMIVQTAICTRLDGSVSGLTIELAALRSIILRHERQLMEAPR